MANYKYKKTDNWRLSLYDAADNIGHNIIDTNKIPDVDSNVLSYIISGFLCSYMDFKSHKDLKKALKELITELEQEYNKI